jgi:hypothetical protein
MLTLQHSCGKEILPTNISTASLTNMFHKSSPVVTVHKVKRHTTGRKELIFEHPVLWPHNRRSFSYDGSLHDTVRQAAVGYELFTVHAKFATPNLLVKYQK